MEEHEDNQYCFQDRNSSCRKTSISTSIYISMYIFFSLISVFTVFLNLLVIISISHFKQLQTPTNLLILSLAVSDLLVGLIVIPAMTVAIMEPCWVLGAYFCVLFLYAIFSCTSLSLGNLVLISIDRYFAVCVQVPSRCFAECYFSEGFTSSIIMDLVISLVVPCSIIITLYLKIFVVARSQARQVYSKSAFTSITSVQPNKSERKATKTLAMVVFNYLFCWIPMYFLQVIYDASKDSSSAFICFLLLTNSLVNPIIYALFYPWFKVTAKRILTLKLMFYTS